LYDVAESMFNMFVQTSFMGTDERKDIASDWFAGSSEMIGNALGCEICLGGMKVVQMFMASDFFVNAVINFGDSLCYAIRNKFMYDSCSGYVASSVPAISNGLTGFLITPEYACEHELGSCINHQWYTPISTQRVIDKLILHKPEWLKKDNFQNYLYQEIAADPNPRKTLSMIHFTDLHVDLDYQVGTNKTCKNVMCCR
jgi:hypothetical protein